MKLQSIRQFSNQDNIEYWDNIYDQPDFNGECYRQRMGIVLSWLESMRLSENSIILDAGSGTGRFAYEVINRGYKVVGIDYSHSMTVKASRSYIPMSKQNEAFLQGDVETLPFQNSTFEVIVCLGVVAYLKTEGKALRELARVLKPNGVIAISIVNKARLANRLDLPFLLSILIKRVKYGITAIWKRGNENNDSDSLTTFLIPKFINSLELAGFTVQEYQTVPWKLLTFFGMEILPKKIAEKITLFFEQFSNIPMVGSFGGMCIIRAEKISN